MAEIFKDAQAFNNHPNRWNHDLSHKTYGSFKAGRIYPVFTHLMQPTDSIRLDIASLLQFMPTPTPLQSNVRVIFHAFFDRMKNILHPWQDFIEGLDESIELPYILPSVQEFKAGSLHDYLDIPCNVVINGEQDFSQRYSFAANPSPLVLLNSDGSYSNFYASGQVFNAHVQAGKGFLLMSAPSKVAPAEDPNTPFAGLSRMVLPHFPFKIEEGVYPNLVKIRVSLSDTIFTDLTAPYRLVNTNGNSSPTDEPYEVVWQSSNLTTALNELGFDGTQYIHLDLCFFWDDQEGPATVVIDSDFEFSYNRNVYPSMMVQSHYYVYGSYDYSQFPEMCPYQTQEYPGSPRIPLRSLRHRVYEANFNAFYRNIHGNQPFMIDGQVKYNRYNTNLDGGLDDMTYDFYNRNWELDAYTSALASPQQGQQPLVGISSTGRLTIVDDDGTRSTAQLFDLDENGNQGLGITQMNAATEQHRSLMMSLASTGISINDLRETNALQKFLETNIRKGFRYIDFIKGHFGSAPKHAELDMPEFLGGFSVKLDVGKVTNTNQAAVEFDSNAVLGQFAGSAQAFGTSKHKISYYADDYGYLQVLMMIVPDAAYSQILPKDYLYTDPLDFPFPEFSNLSYQPIDYREFCPGECYKDMMSDSNKHLTDVFGYQRPQHERVWLPDRLHGQFLTSMNNYAVNRVFEHRPELGNDFFQIKPEEMQRNFTVLKGDDDICFGQVAFAIDYKQPVPRICIPSIGR